MKETILKKSQEESKPDSVTRLAEVSTKAGAAIYLNVMF